MSVPSADRLIPPPGTNSNVFQQLSHEWHEDCRELCLLIIWREIAVEFVYLSQVPPNVGTHNFSDFRYGPVESLAVKPIGSGIGSL